MGNFLWSDPNNWNNGRPLQGDSLNFPALSNFNTATINDLGSGYKFSSITLAGDSYTLAGNDVTLTDAAPLVNSGNYNIISLNINLSSNAPVILCNDGTLGLNGVISGSFTGGLALTVYSVSGGGSLLTLSGANTYTGTTTVTTTSGNNTPGTLAIDSDSAFGTGTLVLSNGACLSTPNAAHAINNAVSVAGAFTVQPGFDLTFAANMALTAPATINSSGSKVIIGGIISGSQPLTEAGIGGLELDNANTFNGGFTLSAGTIIIGNNQALGTSTFKIGVSGNGVLVAGGGARTLAQSVLVNGDFDISGTNDLTLSGPISLDSLTGKNVTLTVDNTGLSTLSGVISDASNPGSMITKQGAGILLLSGTSTNPNTFSGGFNLNDGIVQFSYNQAFGTGTLSVLNVATLQPVAHDGILPNAVMLAAI